MQAQQDPIDTQADEPTEVTGADFVLPSALEAERPRSDGSVRLAAAVALVVAIVGIAAVWVLLDRPSTTTPDVAPAERILPAGPPQPQLLARQDQLPLQVPVPQDRITAVSFHPVDGAAALVLEPIGPARDQGLIGRIVDAFRSGSDDGIPSFRESPAQAADVGAPVGTEVFAPADGRVLSITPLIIDGTAYGDVIAIEPTVNPGVAVVVSGLEADPALAVGAPVTTRPEAWTRLGSVIDLTSALDPALAAYTQDGGNRVQLQVLPATAVAAS